MALAAHYFPNFEQARMGQKVVNLTSDTLSVGLIASGTYTWGATPETQNFVSDFLAGDGTHGALTEVTGGGYTRINLSGVSFTSSGEVVTLTASNPSWSSVTFSTVYGFVYDSTVGAGDSTHPIILYWDFGGTQSVVSSTFTITINASGLVTWTAS